MKIKNLKLSAKLTTLILSGVLLTGCGKKDIEMIPESILEVIDQNADMTNLDEILALSETVNIRENNDENLKSENLLENINRLEKRLKLEQKIESLELENTDKLKKLSKKKKEQLQSLTEEEVESLILAYQDEKITLIEKSRLTQQLSVIQKQYQTWLENNGCSVTASILKRLIKAEVCTVSGLEPQYYNYCKIQRQETGSSSKKQIEVFDPISGFKTEYYLTEKSGILWDTLMSLYDTQSYAGESKSYDEVSDDIIEALNHAKIAIVSGIQLDDKKETLLPVSSEEEARKKLEEKEKLKTK